MAWIIEPKEGETSNAYEAWRSDAWKYDVARRVYLAIDALQISNPYDWTQQNSEIVTSVMCDMYMEGSCSFTGEEIRWVKAITLASIEKIINFNLFN